jgi:ABC-type phosphate transport system substrate-binding protein
MRVPSNVARRLALTLAMLAAAGAGAQSEIAFKVIVHPGVAGERVPRQRLSDIFLRKALLWGDGVAIAPVDQSTTSPVRASFSKQVHAQSVAAVQAYWFRQISAGRSRPPSVKASDGDVVRFVAETAGGIGYVSADAALPPTVKVIGIE